MKPRVRAPQPRVTLNYLLPSTLGPALPFNEFLQHTRQNGLNARSLYALIALRYKRWFYGVLLMINFAPLGKYSCGAFAQPASPGYARGFRIVAGCGGRAGDPRGCFNVGGPAFLTEHASPIRLAARGEVTPWISGDSEFRSSFRTRRFLFISTRSLAYAQFL